MKYLNTILYFFLCCGCTYSGIKYVSHSSVKDVFKFKLEESLIEINAIDSLSYTIFDVDNSGDNLLILNQFSNEIEQYSLSNKKFIRRSQYLQSLQEEVKSIHYISNDSIFVFSKTSVYLAADTLKRIKFLHITGDEFGLGNLGYFPSIWNFKDSSFYMQSFSAKYDQTKSFKFYKVPIEARIKVNSNKIEFLPMSYSKLYQENFYGYSNFVYREFHKDKSIYTFAIDPNIYVLEHPSLEFKTYGGKSDYHKKDAIPIPKKERNNRQYKFSKLTENICYGNLIYDPYRKLYYRFFSKDVPEKNEDGTFNSFGDKPLILMIFSEDFKLLREIELKNYTYNSANSFVGKDGLYLAQSHYKNEFHGNKKLRFTLLSFNK